MDNGTCGECQLVKHCFFSIVCMFNNGKNMELHYNGLSRLALRNVVILPSQDRGNNTTKKGTSK